MERWVFPTGCLQSTAHLMSANLEGGSCWLCLKPGGDWSRWERLVSGDCVWREGQKMVWYCKQDVFPSKFLMLFFFNVYDCLSTNMWVPLLCLVLVNIRRHQIPWTWSHRWLQTTMWVLGFTSTSPGRAASVLDHWAIPPPWVCSVRLLVREMIWDAGFVLGRIESPEEKLEERGATFKPTKGKTQCRRKMARVTPWPVRCMPLVGFVFYLVLEVLCIEPRISYMLDKYFIRALSVLPLKIDSHCDSFGCPRPYFEILTFNRFLLSSPGWPQMCSTPPRFWLLKHMDVFLMS